MTHRGYLRIKGWENFQHYKDRSPPWIKLHRDLLRDYEFSCLQDASKLHLMLIWLLASQLDNRIPNDAAWIQKQIGTDDVPNLKALIDMGFLIDDSNTLADCKQSAIVETETEAYKQETEKENTLSDSGESDEIAFADWWDAYGKRVDRKWCESWWKRKAWKKAGATPSQIMADTISRKNASIKWAEGFQPNPKTYLNGHRWTDELDTQPASIAPKKQTHADRVFQSIQEKSVSHEP